MKLSKIACLAILTAGMMPAGAQRRGDVPVSLSGIYPHLAMYNNEGECGTGAVVPWAGRLWVITYGPHLPMGSSDKLYEIRPDMSRTVRSESIGGTPANRMIHPESGQLFIGPYAVDSTGAVRTIPYKRMPGRHTGNARHLTAPADKIYYGTMEEGFYEVDVHSLDVRELYADGNFIKQQGRGGYGPANTLLPGVHGKGLYSGQGVLVFSNNGEGSNEALTRFDIEAGVLAEWDGRTWSVVRRNQFTEITGPGGIMGNPNPAEDPIWATGWDHKSVLLGVREAGRGWTFYRLPKASHSYDGAHGWNTEWPRIRNVGTAARPDYLMTMHGMFWRFPAGFRPGSAAGIRPRSAYLKVIGDFARWNDRLVFGCDDSAQKEFLNARKAKGGLPGPGQSNSNLWFTSPDLPDCLGPATASGSVWQRDTVEAGACSEPFLFAGWRHRACWVENRGNGPVRLSFEVDRKGDGRWTPLREERVEAGQSAFVSFRTKENGEWVRVRTDRSAVLTVCFNYTDDDRRSAKSDALFAGLAGVTERECLGGLLKSLGSDRRSLAVEACRLTEKGTEVTGYYEMGEDFRLLPKDDAATDRFMRTRMAVSEVPFTVESGSVLLVDERGRRWRLPLGGAGFTELGQRHMMRVCREVATERDLFHCQGTFFELPAENADGFAKIRPVASHGFRIHDYASYRGLLVMTGIDPKKAAGNEHIIRSADGKAAVWAGAIDDLWRLGKPTGHGGPWVDSDVQAGACSDPFLISHYDRRELTLSHKAAHPVTFTVEVDATGNGDYMTYGRYTVGPGKSFRHVFPKSFGGRWIRFRSDSAARVTTWLEYR